MPCTFDDSTCEELIGTSFNGKIKKTPCKPYQYTVEETGENIERFHRYEFIDEELDLVEENLITQEEVI